MAHFDILLVASRFFVVVLKGCPVNCDREGLEVVLELSRDDKEGQH